MFTTTVLQGVPVMSSPRPDTINRDAHYVTLTFGTGSVYLFLDSVADADAWADLFCTLSNQLAAIAADEEEPVACPI